MKLIDRFGNSLNKICCSINKKSKKCELVKKNEIIGEQIVDLNQTKMAQYQYRSINNKDKKVRKQNRILTIRRLFFMFLSALLFNFGVLAFLSKADTIPSGVSGIPTLIVTLLKDNPEIKKYFALMYLGANIPLLLLFGFRIKRSFVLLTLSFMLFQIVTNFVFTLEPVEKFIKTAFDVAPGWSSRIELKPGLIVDNPNTWPIFINGIIGSLFLGVAIAVAWKNGGSTGGTDIVAYFFSTKKKKSISSILMIVSFTTTLTFLLIFGLVEPHSHSFTIKLVDDGKGGYLQEYALSNSRVIFGMREISTLLYIFIVNTLVGIIYPKYKKVSMEIFTNDPSKVLAYFKTINYWHAYTIYTAKSGYTGNNVYRIETTLLLLESKPIMRDLKAIDSNLWVKIKPVMSIVGRFSTKFVD